jgi:hypothetical protein
MGFCSSTGADGRVLLGSSNITDISASPNITRMLNATGYRARMPSLTLRRPVI